jgi:hypothetical protein
VLTAIQQGGAAKGEETIRAEARQQGAVGHYVADVTFPSAGVWEWQIAVPTYYVQDSPSGSNAAILVPLTVLPAVVSAQASSAAPGTQPAPAPASATTTLLGITPAVLRWGGVILLIAAAGIALAAQRGTIGRRRAARVQ